MKVFLELPALVNPSEGLVFWALIAFGTVVFILRKFAWNPIIKALKDREESIENSLQQAENARTEMAKMMSDNESLLRQAREERDVILKEAREMKDKIIAEAKAAADDEKGKMLSRASEEINKQKQNAIDELRKEVAGFSVQIAEKIIGKELQNADSQKSFIESQLATLKSGSKAGLN